MGIRDLLVDRQNGGESMKCCWDCCSVRWLLKWQSFVHWLVCEIVQMCCLASCCAPGYRWAGKVMKSQLSLRELYSYQMEVRPKRAIGVAATPSQAAASSADWRWTNCHEIFRFISLCDACYWEAPSRRQNHTVHVVITTMQAIIFSTKTKVSAHYGMMRMMMTGVERRWVIFLITYK